MTNSFNEYPNTNSSMAMGDQMGGDELSFLDLLQAIVDNLRLLVLAPLSVAFFCMGCQLFNATHIHRQDTVLAASAATKCCGQHVGNSW